ncbi:MAG: HD domain-containing protein [Chloroflexi bacterium]|nr:HD domain-containing protein [Chloroflexota bacterium]
MIKWASEQAASFIAPLGNRWLHVQGVVRQAYQVSKILNENDCPYLIAAAYLHDIGYAPSLKKTNFHPLDGAYYIRSFGHERLASLVAHHFQARIEAELLGCTQDLDKFPREYSLLADALDYCDCTTGPTGIAVSWEERANEIQTRYTENSVAVQSLHKAKPYLTLAITRVQQALNALRP